jgi:hypothetical protein
MTRVHKLRLVFHANSLDKKDSPMGAMGWEVKASTRSPPAIVGFSQVERVHL